MRVGVGPNSTKVQDFKIGRLTQQVGYGILNTMNSIDVRVPGVQDVRLVLRAQQVLERLGVYVEGYSHATGIRIIFRRYSETPVCLLCNFT